MSAQGEPVGEIELAALVELDRAVFGAESWGEWTWHEAVTSEHRRVGIEYDADGLAGYVVVAILGDVGELERIAVRDDLRRQGIGRRLLDAAVAQARENGARALVLEVRDDNTTAREFYRNAMFYEVSRRPGYYDRGSVDAVVLQLTWMQDD